MTSAAHNHEAAFRDEEVASRYPYAVRHHFRATLPARVVLRAVEREEHARELKLLGESYLTAAVVDGKVEFFAGSDPVWHAATIPLKRIVGIETSSEFDYTPPSVNPTLRLKLTEPNTEPLDVDLEVFTFDGQLHQTTDLRPVVAWWQEATAR